MIEAPRREPCLQMPIVKQESTSKRDMPWLTESRNMWPRPHGQVRGLGGFGGLFSLGSRFTDPVLVSGTDGVGTKLLVAQQLGQHETIGIDLVAMCVNDIATSGAEPLFFLDYFATGKLSPEVTVEVVAGISEGCVQAGCASLEGRR